MAFKCLRYFVMFKKGPQHHISACVTVHSEGQMCKDHFTAGREFEITRTQMHNMHAGVSSSGRTVQLGSFIYSHRGGY